VRLAIQYALILVAVAISIYLLRGYRGPFRKWLGIGLAVAMLFPLLLWQVLWPLPFEIDPDKRKVEYKFLSRSYAEEFARLNGAGPPVAEARPPEPIEASLAEEGSTAGPSPAVPAQTEEDALAKAYKEGRFQDCIEELESELKRISPETPFHPVVGRNFLAQTSDLANWLERFHEKSARRFVPGAMYLEMTRFDINFDSWDLYGYSYIERVDKPQDWDCEEEDDLFILRGMEDMQKAMQEYRALELKTDEPPAHLREATECAFVLIMLHMQHLVREAHAECRRRGHPAGRIRILAAVHDDSSVFCSDPPAGAGPAPASPAPSPRNFLSMDFYRLEYPGTWSINRSERGYDLNDLFTLEGPHGAYVRLEFYNEAALKSADEVQAENARIVWNRENVEPPTDLQARARKTIREMAMRDVSAKRFGRWGALDGTGIDFRGQLDGRPAHGRYFTARSGSRTFVVFEFRFDDCPPGVLEDMEVVRSSFRWEDPPAPA
jgi:hypothetical protein